MCDNDDDKNNVHSFFKWHFMVVFNILGALVTSYKNKTTAINVEMAANYMLENLKKLPHFKIK